MSSIEITYDGNINPWILNKILKIDKKNIKILDVGCWKWQLWKEVLWKRSDCMFYGIEKFAPKTDAENAGYIEIYDIDLHQPETINQIQNQFDIIICGDVLEHTLDPQKVLEKLKICLVPDWIILVSLPNICFIQNRISHLFGRWNYAPPGVGGIMDMTHYRFFSLHSMKQLFLKSGFQIIEYRWLWFIRSFLKILNPLSYFWPNMWAMQIVFLIKK